MGSENNGISDYVQPKEDLEVKVSNFFQRVSSPVLADLDLDFGPVLTEYMYPRKITDLFRGMQMTIIGRYKNASDLRDVTLKLTGKVGKETRSFNYPGLDFASKNDENDFLPRFLSRSGRTGRRRKHATRSWNSALDTDSLRHTRLTSRPTAR